MIARFSLYGFLKNLQFHEPFLILYFLQLGLSFFQIGLLISFRSVCINIMEVPSGALADMYGRKSSMVFSLSSYIVSFVLFTAAAGQALLYPAMFFFSIGEAFRTGTHKAMIFDWLKRSGRTGEKVRVYGYTRSWSKIGSAVSVIASALIVIITEQYRWVFILTVVPFIAGIWNILCYPSYLNNRAGSGVIDIQAVYSHLVTTLKAMMHDRKVKKLIIQGMGFEGVFDVVETYLQPVIRTQVAVLAGFLVFSEKESTAIGIGIVYFIIHNISAFSSRKSYRFLKLIKSEAGALNALVLTGTVIIIVSSIGMKFNIYAISIVSIVLLFVLQNLWRPILISGYDDSSTGNVQATVLSIESQAKSLGIFILAPLAGLAADTWGIFSAFFLLAIIMVTVYIFSVLYGTSKSPANS